MPFSTSSWLSPASRTAAWAVRPASQTLVGSSAAVLGDEPGAGCSRVVLDSRRATRPFAGRLQCLEGLRACGADVSLPLLPALWPRAEVHRGGLQGPGSFGASKCLGPALVVLLERTMLLKTLCTLAFCEAKQAGEMGPQAKPCLFSYIPSYLRYIMCELLKNSFRATLMTSSSVDDISKRPVRIRVCRDEHRVAIPGER